ncbi:hypothetical protein F2P81_001663 [Scophthalmus maximus]|uniref:Uncharacterized protein n=1 Tax=Scophthalmus maximus TaxID=52904 RepID=A0A6A4TPI9_SCOMX|nr:hypothetical protein F2P81_001663 [Scophthalmus maximus]
MCLVEAEKCIVREGSCQLFNWTCLTATARRVTSDLFNSNEIAFEQQNAALLDQQTVSSEVEVSLRKKIMKYGDEPVVGTRRHYLPAVLIHPSSVKCCFYRTQKSGNSNHGKVNIETALSFPSHSHRYDL